MRILIASDSYKGSLSSNEVNHIIKETLLEMDPNLDIICLPVADGGENSLECALGLENAELISCEVIGPYGKKVNAEYVKINDLGFIEMARASGIMLDETRNPMLASTFGVGQLIKDALDKGCTQFIICLGGSATNDAGCGMASALGVKFYKDNCEIQPIPLELKDCTHIDLSDVDKRIYDCKFTLACDVNNPLLGKNGASYIYGPQKGANLQMIIELDSILEHVSALIEKETGKSCCHLAGAGAAGGLGFGLMCFCNGVKQSGIETMLEMIHFDEIVQECDFVITGEGCTDYQSLNGKTPIGVSLASRKYKKPVVLISGKIEENLDLSQYGIIQQIACVDMSCELQDAIKHAKENLRKAVRKIEV